MNLYEFDKCEIPFYIMDNVFRQTINGGSLFYNVTKPHEYECCSYKEIFIIHDERLVRCTKNVRIKGYIPISTKCTNIYLVAQHPL